MKRMLKALGTKRLNLIYDESPSNFAFKFNLRRYIWAEAQLRSKVERAAALEAAEKAKELVKNSKEPRESTVKRNSKKSRENNKVPAKISPIEWAAEAEAAAAAAVQVNMVRRCMLPLSHPC